jgi:hypothetical protein
MDARRSSYFAPGQDELAEPALDANRLDCDDIATSRRRMTTSESKTDCRGGLRSLA